MRTTSVLHVRTPGGLEVHLDDAAGRVTISGQGSTIRIDSTGVTIDAAAQVHVNASQVSVSAGLLNVDAGMAKFSGVVECQTLVANSVVAANYTPGAGNVW
jgi:phage baseplate assembly protein gpV